MGYYNSCRGRGKVRRGIVGPNPCVRPNRHCTGSSHMPAWPGTKPGLLPHLYQQLAQRISIRFVGMGTTLALYTHCLFTFLFCSDNEEFHQWRIMKQSAGQGYSAQDPTDSGQSTCYHLGTGEKVKTESKYKSGYNSIPT